jgi:hypothetical protein
MKGLERSRALGVALVVFAVAMNAPFGWLAVNFDYPQVLRRGPAEVFGLVRAGGAPLLTAWYAYALVALVFAPLALSVVARICSEPLRASARAAGVLAAVAQALGLLRWVFVVPVLARIEGDAGLSAAERDAARVSFEALHQLFGVAIGEHLGQVCTAAWGALISAGLAGRGLRALAGIGAAVSTCLCVGLAEGFATVLNFDPGLLAHATPLGFLAFSAWLAALGVSFARAQSEPARGAA